MNCPIYYNDDVKRRRTHPKIFPKNEAETTGGILEMRPERVRVEDNYKAVKLAYNARSENVVTQAIFDRGKWLPQRAENRPLVQRRSVLDGYDPHGSGVGIGHKNKYLAGIFIRRWRSIYRANQILPSKIDYILACLSN